MYAIILIYLLDIILNRPKSQAFFSGSTYLCLCLVCLFLMVIYFIFVVAIGQFDDTGTREVRYAYQMDFLAETSYKAASYYIFLDDHGLQISETNLEEVFFRETI